MILNNERNTGLIQMIIAMIMMGTVGYFVIESGQEPYEVVFYRCLFGAFLLFFYCLFTGMFKNTGLTNKKTILIIISGFFLIINWISLFASFTLASISVSTTIYHFQPFIFLILWSIIANEKISRNKYFWMILAFIGVILVSDVDLRNLKLNSNYVIGLLLALLAAFFWAISAVIVKKIQGIKPHIVVLFQMIVGVLILTPLIDFNNINGIAENQWYDLFILGLVHTCITYILMYSAYQKISAISIAILTFIYPVVAILIDYIFYENKLNIVQILGVFLILFSSFASNQNFNIFKNKRKLET